MANISYARNWSVISHSFNSVDVKIVSMYYLKNLQGLKYIVFLCII